MEPHLLSPLTSRLPHDVAPEASMAPAQFFGSEAPIEDYCLCHT